MRVNTAPTVKSVNQEGTVVKSLSPEQELRRTIMACLLWEESFYEDGQTVAERMTALIKKSASTRPPRWLSKPARR